MKKILMFSMALLLSIPGVCQDKITIAGKTYDCEIIKVDRDYIYVVVAGREDQGERRFRLESVESYEYGVIDIPLNDQGKIYYEGIIEIPGKSKNDLYLIAREWFVDTYMDADAVLQLDDKEAGKLMGRGLYVYDFNYGLSVMTMELRFVLNIDVKDEKYRYRIYNFIGAEENSFISGMLETEAKYNVDFDNEYALLKKGDQVTKRAKRLEGFNQEVQNIIVSLEHAMRTREIDEW